MSAARQAMINRRRRALLRPGRPPPPAPAPPGPPGPPGPTPSGASGSAGASTDARPTDARPPAVGMVARPAAGDESPNGSNPPSEPDCPPENGSKPPGRTEARPSPARPALALADAAPADAEPTGADPADRDPTEAVPVDAEPDDDRPTLARPFVRADAVTARPSPANGSKPLSPAEPRRDAGERPVPCAAAAWPLWPPPPLSRYPSPGPSARACGA